MDARTKVINKETGQRGVVVSDPWGCCLHNEVPVVWEGDTGFLGTFEDSLTIIGPENAKPVAKKCGAGSSECCIFLTCGAGGFCCERFGSLRYALIGKEMNAKRHPTEMWPDCMNQGDIDGGID